MLAMPSFSAELVRVEPVSARVQSLTFQCATPFERAAGQYILLTLDEGSSHAFSVASPFDPSAPGHFQIAVARGTTAGAVLELQLGDVVSITGPSGALVWKEDTASLLIATGTGIAPLRAIALEQLARSSSTPLTLLFGCRDDSEALWGAEFATLALEYPRFRYLQTQSQPLAGYAGRNGRVQAYVPELVRALGPGMRAYLCGHTPMVKDCTTLLIEHGVMPEHIHGESY